MLNRLIDHWWIVLIRGIVGILFGLLALLWPGITILALVALFGAYALAQGIPSIVAAVAKGRQHQPWGALAFEGVVGVGAGIVTFAWPGVTTVALLVVIAVWALWTGILEVAQGVRIRKEVEGEWMLYISGAASVLFGILLLISPGSGALALTWLIGVYAVAVGLLFVVLAFRLRRMRGHLPGPDAAPAL